MSVLTRNNIVTNGLVLYLDALNPQSIPLDPTINLQLNSENFTASGWSSNNIITTSSISAPYGTGNALLSSAVGIYSGIYQNTIVSSSGLYTATYFVKYINQPTYTIVQEGIPLAVASFNIQNGTKGGLGGTAGFFYNSTIEPAPNGYYRISLTMNVTQSSITLQPKLWTGGYNDNNNSGSQVYVWGSQLEKSSYPTPYIQSTSTRGQRTTWYDMSGNNNTATFTTGSPLAPSSSKASIPQYNYLNERVLNFDGTGSYAFIPSITTTPSPSTVSLTFKRPSVISNRLFMWDHNNGNGFGRSQRVFDTSMLLLPTNNTNTTISSTAMTNALSVPNQWTNLVYTITGSLVNVYVNGISVVADFTMAAPFTSASITAPVYIGRLDSGIDSFFTTGSYASVLIYNRVLSQAEVLQNYNTTKTRFSLT